MTDELKPCPFCGGMNLQLVPPSANTPRSLAVAYMRCGTCGTQGPYIHVVLNETKEQVVFNKWNTRHTPDIQQAIDSALESVAQEFDKDSWLESCGGFNFARYIRSRIGAVGEQP